MITKNPVLLCGRSVWDQSFFPPDEFAERICALDLLMAEQNLDGLVVFGKGAHYANLAYLTHFIPKSGWGLALIPRAGDPTLFFSAGGERDIPFAKKVTWISDVRHIKSAGNDMAALLKEKHPGFKRIGLVDVNLMSGQACDGLLSSLSETETVDARPLMKVARAGLRPRERSAIIHAASIACRAKKKAMEVFSGGKSIQRALVQAELTARRLGSHDVRLLTPGGYGPYLSPFETSNPAASDRLVAYIAVEFQGYWADVAVTFPATNSGLAEKARHALQSMAAAAKPGVAGGEVASHALEELGPELGRMALEVGLGNGIGLSLEEPPFITIDGRDDLVEGNALSLRVYLHDDQNAVFVSDLVVIDEKGGKSILG
jgi:Xaa-Pro aminopeptidase